MTELHEQTAAREEMSSSSSSSKSSANFARSETLKASEIDEIRQRRDELEREQRKLDELLKQKQAPAAAAAEPKKKFDRADAEITEAMRVARLMHFRVETTKQALAQAEAEATQADAKVLSLVRRRP